MSELAIRILTYCKERHWNVSLNDLLKANEDIHSEDARIALKELEDLGYIDTSYKRSDDNWILALVRCYNAMGWSLYE